MTTPCPQKEGQYKVADLGLAQLVHEAFDLRPRALIERLGLLDKDAAAQLA